MGNSEQLSCGSSSHWGQVWRNIHIEFQLIILAVTGSDPIKSCIEMRLVSTTTKRMSSFHEKLYNFRLQWLLYHSFIEWIKGISLSLIMEEFMTHTRRYHMWASIPCRDQQESIALLQGAHTGWHPIQATSVQQLSRQITLQGSTSNGRLNSSA